ncbi:Uncharacterised protein [Chlamydia trachomatis]|nr:Uncharacterised protein [Chlamydia trachomatis]
MKKHNQKDALQHPSDRWLDNLPNYAVKTYAANAQQHDKYSKPHQERIEHYSNQDYCAYEKREFARFSTVLQKLQRADFEEPYSAIFATL